MESGQALTRNSIKEELAILSTWQWISVIVLVVGAVSWAFSVKSDIAAIRVSLQYISEWAHGKDSVINEHERRITINEREIEHLKGKSK